MNDIELIRQWRNSPIAFIRDVWGFTPQPLLPEYEERIKTCDLGEVTVEWFVLKTRQEVYQEKLITWQQFLIVLAVERAVQKTGKARITVESGHGTGKSATLSMLILWFLFCFYNAQIPCTAPTSDQLFDVLWKEISIWLGRMPKEIKDKYEWQSSYVRIVESPETWFARAKTARREAPEALAGMHGDHVMFVIDEASGVPEEIFNTAEGALTSENILVVMISNHTRIVGYFHESHKSDKENWQCLSFDSEESPIVDKKFVARIEEKHGRDSDEFCIRVSGKAPREEAMDDKGWVPLLNESDIRETTDDSFLGYVRLGIDPAGEGKDKAAWAVRDQFKARIVHTEQKSTAKGIAHKSLTLMTEYNVDHPSTYLDNFGEGANVGMEMAALTRQGIQAINVGDEAQDRETYENRRAEAFWRLRMWLRTGGEIFIDKELKDELLSIRYRRNPSGKIQIMGKVEMKREGLKSPNKADALALTFLDEWTDKIDNRPLIRDTSAGRLGE